MPHNSIQLVILVLVVVSSTKSASSYNVRMDSPTSRPSFERYKELRDDLMNIHQSRALGSDVLLNEEEQQFNAILMDLKADELARGFENPFNFTPARHFFDTIKSVESSQLFQLIRKMPKGTT